MRRYLLAALAVLLIASGAHAQTPTYNPLVTYYTAAPVAVGPYLSTDIVGMVRAGVLYRIPGNAAFMPSLDNNRVLGVVSGGPTVPTSLTPTQLTTLVNPFSSSLSGAVPASGGSATKFLTGAGTFLALTVPHVCDGFSAENGATTSGSPNFSSATGGFAVAAVGKKITISGAGPTRYFGSATISGGGAGHTVGEEIPITGGTGTAGTVIVRAVTGGAITAVAGKAGSLGSYSGVPSNPVAVGDATLTVTWLRDSLVTTIQSVTNSTAVVLAANASATVSSALWGYGTDYATEINAAVATGSKINLPNGICGVGTAIAVSSSQVLLGNGTGGYSSAPTEVMWLGPVGGTVLALDNGSLINGTVVGPFNLLGLGAASYGARFLGVAHSTINLQARAVKDFGFSFAESADGAYDVFFNDFKLVAAVNHASSQNAIGLSFPIATISSGLHDVNGNNFYNTAVMHRDGNGIDLQEGYLNNFYMTQLYSPGNGWGIRFGGSSVDSRQTARNNVLYNLISMNNLLSDGGTWPARQNRILPLDRIQYATTATIAAGSTLFCTSSAGDQSLCTAYGYDSRSCSNPVLTATTANYVAMGCGGTITPNYSGKVRFTVDGSMLNATAGSGVIATIYSGTGTAPVNGANIETAGTTRAQCGGFPVLANTPSGTFKSPFSITCETSGLALAAARWYDVGIKAVVGNNASIENVRLSSAELP